MTLLFPALPIINAENFSQMAKSYTVVVVLIWASWDPTSRSLDARLRQDNDGYTNLHLSAMDIDQEQNWPLAESWGVMTTPTLVCVFNSLLHELFVGLRPELQMKAKLTEWNSLRNE